MATDPDDVYETCTAAADLIERDGLTCGMYWEPTREQWVNGRRNYEPGMPVCTLGALRVAMGMTQIGMGNWTTCAATKAVEAEVSARIGGLLHGSGGIGTWNDKIATPESAVSLLRDVAAKHQPDEYRSVPGGTALDAPGGGGA